MGVAVIFAAIIGLFKCTGSGYKIGPMSQNESQAWITGDISGENVTINYNVPETETKKAIQMLENKLNNTKTAVDLNREEVRSIALALKDLDQRTSGIEKLPDGRTKFGDFITGSPTVLLEEHDASIREFNQHNFQAALEHSKKAIDAFEQTADSSGIKTGELTDEKVSKLYYQGSLSAHRANRNDLAYEWIRRAIDKHRTAEKEKLLAAVLANLGKTEESLKIVEQLLSENSDDQWLV